MKLVDFNVFGSVTDSLLYSWDELTGDAFRADYFKPDEIELRLNEVQVNVQHSDVAMYGYPIDSLALSDLNAEKLASLALQVSH